MMLSDRLSHLQRGSLCSQLSGYENEFQQGFLKSDRFHLCHFMILSIKANVSCPEDVYSMTLVCFFTSTAPNASFNWRFSRTWYGWTVELNPPVKMTRSPPKMCS